MSGGGDREPDSADRVEAIRHEFSNARRDFEVAASRYKEAMARLQGTIGRFEQPLAEREPPAESASARLHAELAAQAVVEQAKGIIMARQGCDADAAASILGEEADRAGISVGAMASRLTRQVADGGSLAGPGPGQANLYRPDAGSG